MEKRFQFRHVNELTGLFVLGVVALAVAGVIFSGHSQRWFARKYVFEVRLPEQGTSGLRRGDEVFILGVSAGFVDDIRVTGDDRMNARVKIDHDFERFVRSDSTATLRKVFGVAGDSFMEITRGTNAPLPAHGATIVCLATEELPARMERILEELRAELVPVAKKAGATLDEWTKLGTDLQKTGEQLHQFVARLDGLATGLEQGKGTVGKVLTDTALADEAQRLLARANEALSGLQSAVTNLNAAAQNVQIGTTRLPEITGALANEAKDLPGLVQQTQMSMRELERLIEAVERHWLLRKYVNKTDPPPPRPLPGVEELNKKPVKVVRSPRGAER
jgi:phospholipid/cholesterol/gamma-HCH transport system substrate-binding protein